MEEYEGQGKAGRRRQERQRQGKVEWEDRSDMYREEINGGGSRMREKRREEEEEVQGGVRSLCESK